MIKQCSILMIIIFSLFIFSTVSAAPPPPARIGGSLIVNNKQITQNDTGYTIEVTRLDGTSYEPVAEDSDGLNSSNWFQINIPIYDQNEQPGGAVPGETSVIHIYKDGSEIPVTSPVNGEFVVGESASTTVIYINGSPPVASAGLDQFVDEGDHVILDGSASSDPDDGINNYKWTQLSGKIVTLSNSTAIQPTFTAPDGPTEGLIFELTITDNSGLKDSDTCVIEVEWVNDPPLADAGSDQTVASKSLVTLDGSKSSDPDDGIKSYKWIQTEGTAVALSDSSSVKATFTAPDVGENTEVLKLKLSVIDNDGLQTDDIVVINVGQSVPQTDSDGDGIPDTNDPCPNDTTNTCNNNNGSEPDSDGDGISDTNDPCPNDATNTCNDNNKPDTDGDGIPDYLDKCPEDIKKVSPGTCGCGVADVDTDKDGTLNCNDKCPEDPNKVSVGKCGCGVAETDTDKDEIPDCKDECPDDPDKSAEGECGCGVAETDSDGDETPDCKDTCPDDPANICDTPPSLTPDSDSDGIVDSEDGCPEDANKTAPGTCGCGIADTDSDGDGTLDCNDTCPNDPENKCGDTDTEPDSDSDSDGILDSEDGCPEDADKTAPGSCGCGIADTDTDNDGTLDCNDPCPEDSENKCDSDNDGTSDETDACPDDPDKTEPGTCGCGVADIDSDSDGTFDCEDDDSSSSNCFINTAVSGSMGMLSGIFSFLALCIGISIRTDRISKK